MTSLSRREKRRMAKAESKLDDILTKHFQDEAKLALMQDQYRLVSKELGDKQTRLLKVIRDILSDRYSPESGLSIQELTSIAFKRLGLQYSDEGVYVVERSIQWIKKDTLEKFASIKNGKQDLILCKIDNKLFNASSINYKKYIMQAFQYHGFNIHPKSEYGTMTKGGAMMSFGKDYHPEIPDELKNLKGKEFEEALDKSMPVEKDLDKEGNDIYQNLRGNYTTEQGIQELGYLMHGIDTELYKLKDNETITDFELVKILYPELNTKNLTEDNIEGIAYYVTKIRDALYILTKDPQYIKDEVLNQYFTLFSKKTNK